MLECAIGIITISIPAMRPLFAQLAPGVFVAHVAEDHKKLVDRISRHLRAGGLVRMPSRARSRSSRASQRPMVEKRASTATEATEARDSPSPSRDRIEMIMEERVAEEEKV